MRTKTIKVLIVEDVDVKANSIAQDLERHEPLTKNGIEYEIKTVRADLTKSIDEIIDYIFEDEINCAIVDYKLNSTAECVFSGIEFIEEIKKYNSEFPCFLLTSFSGNVYASETFDSYSVFDFIRVNEEEKELEEFHRKIIEQVLIVRRRLEKWKQEFSSILSSKGESAVIDSRILELDDLISKSLSGVSSIPKKAKKELASDKAEKLYMKINTKIDELLGTLK